MKITMLGSLGTINSLVIPQLIAEKHDVTVITSNEDRLPAIAALGAHGLVGDLLDEKFLGGAFVGADIVYLMIAGGPHGDNFLEQAKLQGKIFRDALADSGVKKVVNLSSVGADAGSEAGALYAYSLIESELRQLTDVSIAFVRPVGFYQNLYRHLPSIIERQALFSNIPADVKQNWVAPQDIAAEISHLLLELPAGKTVHYVVSDNFSGAEFAEALKTELHLPRLHYLVISDQQVKEGLLKNGLSEEFSEALIQMNDYQRQPEKIYADLKAHPDEITEGQVKLADFVKEFAEEYRSATRPAAYSHN
ncbi:SDR family oxidoreductase [Enterococcus sp. LJL120]